MVGLHSNSPLALMQPHVFGPAYQFQVLNSVIGFVMVFVMHQLGTIKNAAKMLAHYVAMLWNVTLSVCHRVIGHTQKSVTLPDSYAPVPSVMVSALWGVQPKTMVQYERGGIASEFASSDNGSARIDCSSLTTSAFANAGRYFFGLRDVGFMGVYAFLNSGIVTLNETRLIVLSSFTGIRNFTAAATFTGFHSLNFTT